MKPGQSLLLSNYRYSMIKFYLGMDNSRNTVLTKHELMLVSKSFAVSGILVAMFDDCMIITISSQSSK